MASDIKSDISTATKLLTETSMRCMKGFGYIWSFRHIAKLGLKSSFGQIVDYSDSVIQLLLKLGCIVPIDPESPQTPDFSKLVDHFAKGEISNFRLAVDAASLVFAHSILDDAVFQYCRVTTIASLNAWEQFVSNRKIKLEEVKDTDYRGLLRLKVDKYLNQLERESLLKKCDQLYKICKPPDDFISMEGYTYDRSRLEKLDTIRHRIVHETGPDKSVKIHDDDLHYMHDSSIHFMVMVNSCFGVCIDPIHAEAFLLAEQQPVSNVRE